MAINFNIYLMSMRCGRKKWLIKKKVLRIYVKTIYVVAELMAKIKPMKSMWFAHLACFVCQVLVDLLPAFTAHWICTDWFHQILESLFLAQDIVIVVVWKAWRALLGRCDIFLAAILWTTTVSIWKQGSVHSLYRLFWCIDWEVAFVLFLWLKE